HQNGVILIDPAEKVVQQTAVSPLPTVLTPAEVDAVLDAADAQRRAAKPDARTYTLVSLLLSTGIKKGECLNLSPNHIDLEAPDGPFLFVRYASPKHRYKERKSELPENWIEAYHEYKRQYEISDRVFPW